MVRKVSLRGATAMYSFKVYWNFGRRWSVRLLHNTKHSVWNSLWSLIILQQIFKIQMIFNFQTLCQSWLNFGVGYTNWLRLWTFLWFPLFLKILKPNGVDSTFVLFLSRKLFMTPKSLLSSQSTNFYTFNFLALTVCVYFSSSFPER